MAHPDLVITVNGSVPEDLARRLGDGATGEMPEQTVLVTPWTDLDGLYDLLSWLRDLGLEVTEVRRTAAQERATAPASRR